MLQILKKTFRKVSFALVGVFLLIHMCMVAAMACAVTSYVILGNAEAAHKVAAYFPRYYWRFFWPLSVLFPLVFAASGFYVQQAGEPRGRTALTAVRSAGLAVLLYLTANYLAFRDDLASRSVAIWFSVLVALGLSAACLARDRLTRAQKLAAGHATKTVDPGVVLVVGGAGYIGSILTRRLLEQGHKVRVLDSLVYGYGSIREILNHPNLGLVVGDCRNIQTVVGAVKGVNAIVHLAAIVGDPACEQDRETALQINYAATRMLIEVAKGYRIRRLVFASSCSVYGVTEDLADEHSETRPLSLYAQTKVDSEEALLHARSEAFHPTILRLATVFGHSWRPRFDLVVNLLTARAHQDGILTIYNGQQWRPFIHVQDVAQAIQDVLKGPLGLVGGQIFNVGDPRLNYTLSQVAEQIRREFPGTRIDYVENADRRNYRVSFDKIRSQLGFRCRWSLEQGIRELKASLELGEIGDYRDVSYNNQKFLEAIGTAAQADEVDARVMAAFAGARSDALSGVFFGAGGQRQLVSPVVPISR